VRWLRSLRGGLCAAGGSLDGGFEEFDEFARNFSSAASTRRASSSSIATVGSSPSR
jgi:hypothetical protein